MKTLKLMAMIALIPMAASAGCEDGSNEAELKAAATLGKETGTSSRLCNATSLAHYYKNGREIHFVDTRCGRESARIAVELKHEEDGYCVAKKAKKLASMPRNKCDAFPKETTDLDDVKHFVRVDVIDGKVLNALKKDSTFHKLLQVAYNGDEEFNIRDFIRDDGGFKQYVDARTGLVFWVVSAYPGDNEYGAIVEETAKGLTFLMAVSDSFLECGW